MTYGVTPTEFSNVEWSMPPTDMQRAVLSAHPATPCAAVRALETHVGVTQAGILLVNYVLDADLRRLRIAPPRRSRRANELWKHTCFEAFVAPDESPGYDELNFAPSGEWAAYRFSAYRTGMQLASGLGTPEIRVQRTPDRLELESATALVDFGIDAAVPQRKPALRLAVAAVIEDEDGRLSYWALRHAEGKPDFHHPQAFALEVAP